MSTTTITPASTDNLISEITNENEARATVARRIYNVHPTRQAGRAKTSAKDIRKNIKSGMFNQRTATGWTLMAVAFETFAAGAWVIAA